MIPAVDPVSKLLPARSDKMPHAATFDEIHQVFVLGAPHTARRETIFAALRLYADLVWSFFPSARLWINGGFVTHKDSPPHDVDVAFLVAGSEITTVFSVESDALALLTLQDVTSLEPGITGIRRLQPFGGLVDSFAVPVDNPAVVQAWQNQWSVASTPTGVGYRTDVLKGYLEVTPDAI
jgi:hypothetical protein